MKLTDGAEEILETLWCELIEGEKEVCDSSLLRDDASLKELIHLGYVEVKNDQIKLTSKGRAEAGSCVRRHRLAERLFVDVFDVKGKLVHETSCRFEHLIHKGLDESICTLLGHPRTCPHGRQIPEGACCKDVKRAPKKLIMPLSDLKPNQKAMVSYLQTRDRGSIQKIIAIGALPKTEVVVLQKFPSIVFRIGKSKFAIDKELASNIFVRIM